MRCVQAASSSWILSVFSMFTFFSCDFYATFFDEQPAWVSTILSLFKVLLEPSYPLILSQLRSRDLESDF